MTGLPISGRATVPMGDLRAVLRAFWHKGRGCAAAWLASELARRAGLSPDRTKSALIVLTTGGLLISAKAGQVDRCYDLTDAGIAALLADLGLSQQVAA